MDKIVYKYRGISREQHRNALLNNELYLSSPRDFNDPFDIVNVENFNLILRTRKDFILFLEYCDYFFIQNFQNIAENVKHFLRQEFGDEHTLKLMLQEVKGFFFGNLVLDKKLENWDDVVKYKIGIDNFIQQLLHINNEIFWASKRIFQFDLYGVISFSKTISNILMWSHYGENHRGYAIGFNMDKLKDSKDFWYAEDVIYSDDFPQVNPLEELDYKNDNPFLLKNENNKFVIHINRYMFKEIFLKSLDWQNEEEFRCAKIFSKTPSTDERIYKYDKSLIQEVVLGYAEDVKYEQEYNQIIDYCLSNKIPVYKMHPIKNKFLLTKELYRE